MGERRGESYRVKRWHHPQYRPPPPASLIFPPLGTSPLLLPLLTPSIFPFVYSTHQSLRGFLFFPPNERVRFLSLNNSYSVRGWVCVTERATEREEDSFCFSYHPSRLCTSVIRHTHTRMLNAQIQWRRKEESRRRKGKGKQRRKIG